MRPALSRHAPILAAGALAAIPLGVQFAFLASLGLGFSFLALAAFGFMPGLGETGFSFAPLRDLLSFPGLAKAVASTVASGVAATCISVSLAIGLVGVLDPTGLASRPGGTLLRRAALSLIAMPHVTIAVGLAFLLSPSGWILRLLAPVLDLRQPPDYLLINDPYGFALALALVVKESPFILAVALASLHRIDVPNQLRVCRTLGYTPGVAWVKIMLPQLYRHIRLPIFAVLAYGLSVVDMSIILGPTLPPTLPVLILRWLVDPDLGKRLTASGGALLQVLLIGMAFLCWRLGEAASRAVWRRALVDGGRSTPRWLGFLFRSVLCLAGGLVAMLGLGAVLGIAVWSVADIWRFPDPWPKAFSLGAWRRAIESIAMPFGTSVLLALLATALALAAAIGCLEAEDRIGHAIGRRAQWMLYLPLLAPEMGFLFGLQVALNTVGASGSPAALLWFHLIFVFPYVFLALSEPWRALDARYARTARCLGAGPWRVLCGVKAPMLRAPLALAAAIGVTVSLALYLPTVLAGAGRIVTLATETVALNGGGDRRVLAVYSLLQAILGGAALGAAVMMARPRRFHDARSDLPAGEIAAPRGVPAA